MGRTKLKKKKITNKVITSTFTRATYQTMCEVLPAYILNEIDIVEMNDNDVIVTTTQLIAGEAYRLMQKAYLEELKEKNMR